MRRRHLWRGGWCVAVAELLALPWIRRQLGRRLLQHRSPSIRCDLRALSGSYDSVRLRGLRRRAWHGNCAVSTGCVVWMHAPRGRHSSAKTRRLCIAAHAMRTRLSPPLAACHTMCSTVSHRHDLTWLPSCHHIRLPSRAALEAQQSSFHPCWGAGATLWNHSSLGAGCW